MDETKTREHAPRRCMGWPDADHRLRRDTDVLIHALGTADRGEELPSFYALGSVGGSMFIHAFRAGDGATRERLLKGLIGGIGTLLLREWMNG